MDTYNMKYNTAAEVVVGTMKKDRVTQEKLAKIMDTTPQNLGQKFKRQDMKVKAFTEIMDILGYDIIVQERVI